MKARDSSDFFEEISSGGIKSFFVTLLSIPFALVAKLLKTFFRIFGVVLGILALIPTLGARSYRTFFVERVCCLAKDLADWVLYPFSVLRCLIRCFRDC